LTRIREFKDGRLQEFKVLQVVEKVEALLTEKKRKIGDIRHEVSFKKHALYAPGYLDQKEKTPKPGRKRKKRGGEDGCKR
jgi:hypothetical protein